MVDPLLIQVPSTLETQRLFLRSFSSADAPVLHEALVESIQDLRAQLWFIPWVSEEQTLQSAEVRCRKAQASFLLRTDLPYLAFEKTSGRLVASVGLHRTNWDLPKTEIGYWSRTGETGKGYVSEGVCALTEWALKGLGAKRVELVTDELNKSSRAVAERCGFTLEGILRNVQMAPSGELRSSCVYAKFPAAA